MTTISKHASLAEWFATPLGEYLLAQERAWIDSVVPDLFGYHALQLGLPKVDLLRESRITNRLTVAPTEGADVLAQWHELPFDAQSVDLVLMPHVLEFVENPHEVLREVDRVLRPEGRALIVGFNPWSLFGARRMWSSTEGPWQGNFVSLVRMKDWLQLLSFEPASGKLGCYVPPLQSSSWRARLAFMESLGDRWWGVAGGVYMLDAVKRVQGMRLIAPNWSGARAKERKFAGAVNRTSPHSTHLRLIK